MKALSIITLLSLTACSTITSGTTQSILIDSQPVREAQCKLTDSKGAQWFVQKTPQSVVVKKGDAPMTVLCNTDTHEGQLTLQETLDNATFGNILAGGLIGAAVDAASGAAQHYPDQAIVIMNKKGVKK